MRKLTEFLGAYPNITLVGLAWALYWRLWLAMVVIYLGVVAVVMLAAFIFE